MLFSELLRLTVFLFAGVATALGALSVVLANQEQPSVLALAVVVVVAGVLVVLIAVAAAATQSSSSGVHCILELRGEQRAPRAFYARRRQSRPLKRRKWR